MEREIPRAKAKHICHRIVMCTFLQYRGLDHRVVSLSTQAKQTYKPKV